MVSICRRCWVTFSFGRLGEGARELAGQRGGCRMANMRPCRYWAQGLGEDWGSGYGGGLSGGEGVMGCGGD